MKGKRVAGSSRELRIRCYTPRTTKLEDTFGFDNADPLTRSLALLRDAPPTVLITNPGRDLFRKPGETVPLEMINRHPTPDKPWPLTSTASGCRGPEPKASPRRNS